MDGKNSGLKKKVKEKKTVDGKKTVNGKKTDVKA